MRLTAKEGSFNVPVQERPTESRKNYNYAPSTNIELELAVSRHTNKIARLTADATVGRGGITDGRTDDTVVR